MFDQNEADLSIEEGSEDFSGFIEEPDDPELNPSYKWITWRTEMNQIMDDNGLGTDVSYFLLCRNF